MLFILPIRTSIRPWRSPYANYALIAANIVIFIISYFAQSQGLIRPFMLTPARPHLWQFITYAFLHGGFMHIAGNMFFLYLFGNNVNDKLGNIGYLCFYLAGAVFSGIGHSLMSNTPVLGASGAVAAVTGAYLVLFPQTLITVFYWFFYFIDTLEMSALYFIGLKLILWDNVVERRLPNVAYDAHLCGYAIGILAMLAMLAAGLLSTSGFDLWTMIKRWNRRRQYRDVVSAGYNPFEGRAKTKQIKAKEIKKTAKQKQFEEKVTDLRDQISRRISERNVSVAAEIYLQLIDLDDKQILPRQYLLDIANQLASQGQNADSARAYEQFLNHYGNYEHVEQVQLMLGVLYSRYLDKPAKAKKHLEDAVKKLTDPGQLQMCQDELSKLKS